MIYQYHVYINENLKLQKIEKKIKNTSNKSKLNRLTKKYKKQKVRVESALNTLESDYGDFDL